MGTHPIFESDFDCLTEYVHSMSSKFSREHLTRKLRDLTESQNSISTLSLWLLHHKKFAHDAAKVWFDELKRNRGSRQLILLYLANDVIQNGKLKGTVSEYVKSFQSFMVPAMAECGKHKDMSIRPKIQRIIQIWESRAIFNVPFILALRQSLISGKVIKPEETKVPRTAIEPPSVQEAEKEADRLKNNRPISPLVDDDRLSDSSPPPPKIRRSSSSTTVLDKKAKSMLSMLNSSTVESDEEKNEVNELDFYPSDVDESTEKAKLTTNSLHEKITKMQKELPSFDQATRRRLSELPREVQDPDAVTSFNENGKLEPLLNMIEFGSSELSNYNDRLESEIRERKELNLGLKLFKEKLLEEQKPSKLSLKESKEKLMQLKSTSIKLDKRIQSLPDLASFSKVTKPLPINDLFS